MDVELVDRRLEHFHLDREVGRRLVFTSGVTLVRLEAPLGLLSTHGHRPVSEQRNVTLETEPVGRWRCRPVRLRDALEIHFIELPKLSDGPVDIQGSVRRFDGSDVDHVGAGEVVVQAPATAGEDEEAV